MLIEISPGLIATVVVTYLTTAGAFIVWVKTELSVLKQRVKTIEDEKEYNEKRVDKNNDEMKMLVHELSRKVDSINSTFGSQLHDLNTKITRAETLAEVFNMMKK